MSKFWEAENLSPILKFHVLSNMFHLRDCWAMANKWKARADGTLYDGRDACLALHVVNSTKRVWCCHVNWYSSKPYSRDGSCVSRRLLWRWSASNWQNIRTFDKLARHRELPPLVTRNFKTNKRSKRVKTILKAFSTGKDLSIDWEYATGRLTLAAKYT
jgi:hypothetical protein